MAWIKVDESIRDHVKIMRAAQALGKTEHEIIGIVVSLWLYCLGNYQEGCFPILEWPIIARAIRIDGDINKMLDVFERCGGDGNSGLIDIDNGLVMVHDWEDYAGRLMDRRRQDRERKRKKRNDATMSAGRPQDCPQDVRRTSAGLSAGCPQNVRTQSKSKSRGRVEEINTHSHARAHAREAAPDGAEDDVERPSPDSSKKKKLENRFDRFWASYPKRTGKGAAKKSWLKIAPSESLTSQILDAVEIQKKSRQWTKDKGQYIPNPATWLNQERWEDEPEPDVQAPRSDIAADNADKLPF